MFWDTIDTEYLEGGKEIKEKLAKPDVTLRTIVEDSNCLLEIRNENTELINFLRREHIFRELMDAVLCPNVSDMSFEMEKYGFVYRCCEVLALASRDLFQELKKYDDIVQKITDFLNSQSGNLNHLTVSFYCKIVLSFLSSETYSFLKILEESRFLEYCIESLEFCAIFELLCSIVNCLPDPAYRNHVKQWYVQNDFANRILDTLSSDKPSEIHENGAALWAEFVKSLREIQYNIEVSEDALLDSLQSEYSVRELLSRMFPDDPADYNPSIVVNGCYVLNTLLETNIIKESPSAMIQRELYQSANTSTFSAQFDIDCSNSATSVEGGGGSFFVIDSKRTVETYCAEYSAHFMRVIIEGLRNENALDRADDALLACTQIIVNLLNTNFLPTHCELLKTFGSPETHFSHLMDFIRYENSTFSIFNSLLDTVVLYILYSSTGAEKPLLTFLIKDLDLPSIIRGAVDDCMPISGEQRQVQSEGENCTSSSTTAKSTRLLTKLQNIAKRTFFLKLADHIVHCQLGALNGDYVDTLLQGAPNYEEWVEFNNRQLDQFANRNRSDKVLSSTARSSNAIEIDAMNVDEIEGNVFTQSSSPFVQYSLHEMSFRHAAKDEKNAFEGVAFDPDDDDSTSDTYQRIRFLEKFLESEDRELAKCKTEFEAKFAISEPPPPESTAKND